MERAFKEFPALERSAADARRFVREVIDGSESAQSLLVAPAALLTAELVSDAVSHEADEIHVLIVCTEERVRVEVYDTRRAPHVGREAPEVHTIRMRILREVADRWSSEHLGFGQRNWFELNVH